MSTFEAHQERADSQESLMESAAAAGRTTTEAAAQLGVSVGTLQGALLSRGRSDILDTLRQNAEARL